jgi:AcrR family transcriptional regulator
MVIKNEQILDAAAEVLARRPDATLQSIAQAAGISRTTIFNKFATRDALLEALAVDALRRVGEVMVRVPADIRGEGSEEFLTVMADVTAGLMPLGPGTVFLRVMPGWGNELDRHWVEAATPLAVYIGRAQSRGLLRGDQPARWLVASYVGLLFAAWDEISEGELGQAQASRLIIETWMSGASR